VTKWDTSLAIAGLCDENNSGDRKGGKGSHGDDKPETKKNCRNLNQEIKLTLGYAQLCYDIIHLTHFYLSHVYSY
jgi:hypothetical protein